jgi:cytochrome c-type biogenesis protein CcmH/NrfG
VLYDLAFAYEKIGRLEQAAELYKMFIEVADPTDSRVRNAKASIEKLEENDK